MGSPIPATLKPICDTFFIANFVKFDWAHKEECGRYMQVLIPHLVSKGFTDAGFLRKNPGQTQYQGYGIDVIAWDLGGNLTHAIDVIASAESPHPWKSEGGGNPTPSPTFIEDKNTAYKTNTDWLSEPMEQPVPNTVPWVPYDENSFQELKRQLAYNYARRPQGPDYDVSVWSARTFHNAYMGPEKTPLGFNAGLERAMRECCSALNVSYEIPPPGWNIGDPI